MFKNLEKKLKRKKLNRRGLTFVQLLAVIALSIILVVVFNGSVDFKKGFNGADTLDWSNQLSEVNSLIASDNNRNKFLYEVTVENIRPYYRAKVLPPSINAFVPPTEVVFEGNTTSKVRSLTFTGAGQVGYTELATANPKISGNTTTAGSTNPLTNYTLKSTKGIDLGTSGRLNSMSFLGSSTIAPFVNTILPNINEHILLGLLGAGTTEIGNDFLRAKETGTAMTLPAGAIDASSKKILEAVFGDDTVDILSDRGKDRVIDLKLIDSQAVRDVMGNKNDITDPSKYRLFWVHSIATKAETVELLKAINIPETAAITFWNALTENVSVNSVIAMPNSEADTVGSQKSDFKYYKFTIND